MAMIENDHECKNRDDVYAAVGLTLFVLVIFGIVFYIFSVSAVDNVTDDCEKFNESFHQISIDKCVSYLKEYPDMTGQEMLDHHYGTNDSFIENFLAQTVIPPTLIKDKCQYFESRRTTCAEDGSFVEKPVTFVGGFNSHCEIFLDFVKDNMSIKGEINEASEITNSVVKNSIIKNSKIENSIVENSNVNGQEEEIMTVKECSSYLRKNPSLTGDAILYIHMNVEKVLLENPISG